MKTFLYSAFTLPSRVLALFGFMASLAMIPSATAATLNAGDIVLVGHNSDTAPESFTFMPLVDIPGGTVVKITDNQWNDAAATPPSAFGTSIISEAKITWTPTATVPAGTLFQISRVSGATSITFLNITTGVSITVTNTNSGGPTTGELFYSGWTGPTTVLNAAGDGLFFYQDADSHPFFLSGFLNYLSHPVLTPPLAGIPLLRMPKFPAPWCLSLGWAIRTESTSAPLPTTMARQARMACPCPTLSFL